MLWPAAACARARGALALATHLASETLREARRSRGAQLVGCASIFLVVLVASTMQTVLDKAPLIFLREAEAGAGQRDVVLRAASAAGAPRADAYAALNYTRLVEALAAAGPRAADFALTAPRVVIGDASLFRADACTPPPGGGGGDDNGGSSSSGDGNGNGSAGSSAWMYRSPSGLACGWSLRGGYVSSCLRRLCPRSATASGVRLVLIDSAREAAMGLGRRPQPAWEPGAVPRGRLVLQEQAARDAGGVQAGDLVYLAFRSGPLLRRALAPQPQGTHADASGWEQRASVFAEAAAPFVVHAVVRDFPGKFGAGEMRGVAVGELEPFLRHVAPFLHPALGDAFRDAAAPSRLFCFASEVSVNLPPAMRSRAYGTANFEQVRAAVADFASALLYVASFPELDAQLSLLPALGLRRFATITLGILLNVLLTLLCVLSAVLVYSLLLINVHSRVFELAVRRMLGAGRPTVVALLLLQAASYALPALAAGLAVAQAATAAVLASFEELSGIAVGVALTPTAVWTAVALATLVPAVASVGPIRSALGPTVREALDARPKAALTAVSVERADDSAVPWPVFVLGLGLFAAGGSVYYALPLSLLSANLGMLAAVFFGLLLGMLAGLVLLALNLELLAERAVAALFLSWWERPELLRLALGNLVAHRLRNRKTFAMFSLAVSFVVLVTVAAEQQLRTAAYAQQQRNGAPVVVRAPLEPDGVSTRGFDPAVAAAVEAVVASFSLEGAPGAAAGVPRRADAFVGASAWASVRLDDALAQTLDAVGSVDGTAAAAAPAQAQGRLYAKTAFLVNVGRTLAWTIYPQAVSPALFASVAADAPATSGGATFSAYNVFSEADVAPAEESALPLSEQLYTARGSQGAVVSSMLRIELALRRGAEAVLQTTAQRDSADAAAALAAASSDQPSSRLESFARSVQRVVGMMDHASFFRFSRSPVWEVGGCLVSLPSYARLLDAHATLAGAQRVDAALVRAVWRRQLNETPSATDSPSAAALALLLSSIDGAAVRPLLAGLGAEDVRMAALFIGGFDAAAVAPAQLDALVAELRAAVARSVEARLGLDPGDDAGGYEVYDARDGTEDEAATVALLNLVFGSLTAVAIALCSFSLVASMGANIAEQRREIGVLLALGLSARALERVYMHEAFVLVVAACSSGVAIGCFIAWTFGLQQR